FINNLKESYPNQNQAIDAFFNCYDSIPTTPHCVENTIEIVTTTTPNQAVVDDALTTEPKRQGVIFSQDVQRQEITDTSQEGLLERFDYYSDIYNSGRSDFLLALRTSNNRNFPEDYYALLDSIIISAVLEDKVAVMELTHQLMETSHANDFFDEEKEITNIASDIADLLMGAFIPNNKINLSKNMLDILVEAYPKEEFLLVSLGLCYLHGGDREKLVMYLDKAIAVSNDLLNVKQFISYTAFLTGDFETCIEHGKEVFTGLDSVSKAMMVVIAYLNLNQIEEASTYLDEILPQIEQELQNEDAFIDSDSSLVELFLMRSMICINNNNLEKAWEYANKAYSFNENSIDALSSMALLHALEENYTDAIPYAEKALEIKLVDDRTSGDAVVYYQYNMNQDNMLRESQLDDQMTGLINQLIGLYAALEDKAQALQHLEWLHDKIPHNKQITVTLADKHLKAERLDKAEVLLKEILKMQPNDIETANILTIALMKQNKFDEAVELTLRMLESDSGAREFYGYSQQFLQSTSAEPEFYFALGLAFGRLMDPVAQQNNLQAASVRLPDEPRTALLNVHLQLAKTNYGDAVSSSEYYLSQTSQETWDAFAQDVSTKKKPKTLSREIEEALMQKLHLNPYDPNTYSMLGVIAHTQGGSTEIERSFYQRALEFMPTNINLHCQIAQTYLLDGDDKVAQRYFAKALQYATSPERRINYSLDGVTTMMLMQIRSFYELRYESTEALIRSVFFMSYCQWEGGIIGSNTDAIATLSAVKRHIPHDQEGLIPEEFKALLQDQIRAMPKDMSENEDVQRILRDIQWEIDNK
ncbi:tetratricopeptide repeat protein, partial [bacterium]|nr:tetratricopeptide repeat protein [bacterium]